LGRSCADDGISNYLGPPIGYAAWRITHTVKQTGEKVVLFMGQPDAPREVIEVECDGNERCGMCNEEIEVRR
jgi:hypothetical protein